MKISFKKDSNLLVLSLIILLAGVLRFYGLTNQSLWVDELHTMIEADPAETWGFLFDYLRCCDPHPPLHFICVKILFSLFGHTEGVARGFSAVCGVVSVWAMYLLGKELLNQRLGIIAAFLTCVNYYNIFYSQEARCYIMAFLFSVLSFVYFIKLIKGLQLKQAFLYSFFTLLLLYSHYYSLFIVAAQGLIAFVLMFGEKENRKQFLKTFAIAGVVMIVGYLPWVPQMLAKANMTSFWIARIEPSFANSFFNTYFGNYELLKPFFALLLIYYCLQVFSESNSLSLEKLKDSPLQLSFFIFFLSIFITYLVPYIRSVLVVPMLYDRYTIVVLPCFLIAIAFGVALIRNTVIQVTILATLIALSLTYLMISRNYYSKSEVTKTQFREITKFISEHKKLYPIVEERTYWQHQYYLKKFNYDVQVFPGNKEATVDSILRGGSDKYDVEGFWIVGAFGGEPHLNPEVQQRLDSSFLRVKEKAFFDIWAELYVNNRNFYNVTMYFDRANYGEMVTPIWGGAVSSKPISMSPGKYTLKINCRGTKALDIYPHINVFLDDKKLGDFNTTEDFSESNFEIEIETESNVILKFDFDNDLLANGEDRNAFIKSVIFEKGGK